MSKYITNKKSKKIFNGIIPRYEDLRISSTKDKIVGYFEYPDGTYKPVHRKKYFFNEIPTGSEIALETIEGLEYLVDGKGSFRDDVQWYLVPKVARTDVQEQAFCVVNTNNQVKFFTGTKAQSKNGYIEIQYTLITDVPIEEDDLK